METKQNLAPDNIMFADFSSLDLDAAIDELEAYGTTTGVLKEWDERGRGRAMPEGAQPSGEAVGGQNPQEQYFKNLASWKFGYDPNKVRTSSQPKQFTVGGKTFNTAGEANLETGDITIWPDQVGANSQGIMAHEVMHQQYAKVLKAYAAERMQWIQAAHDERQDGHRQTEPTDVMDQAGFFNHTPENDTRFPIVSRFDTVYDGHTPYTEGSKFRSAILFEKDGCSDYSKAWWDAFKAGQAQTSQALHETVSEIARIKVENNGNVPAKLVSKPWRDYFNAVEQTYREIKNDPKWEHIMKGVQ